MKRIPSASLSARERALGLLARREQSQFELKRKLRAKGVSSAEAEQIIDDLTGVQLQSDARFAGMLVRKRISDGYGPLRISAELCSHNISREVIRMVLEEEAPNWTDLAKNLYRRKYGQQASFDAKERIKRAAWLVQCGFPAEIARKIAVTADVADKTT